MSAKDCECAACCALNCVCDADWSTDEEIRLRAEVEALRADMNDALPILQDWASRNPKHEYGGRMQDPWGVHALLARIQAASSGGGES